MTLHNPRLYDHFEKIYIHEYTFRGHSSITFGAGGGGWRKILKKPNCSELLGVGGASSKFRQNLIYCIVIAFYGNSVLTTGFI